VGVPYMGQERDATDLDAFSWFFTSEYPQVVRLLTVVLHDAAAAEDLAQDAFVRLHRNWEKVSRYDSPEAWVRRVALNRAFSWRQREGRRRGLELAADPRQEAVPAPSADREDVLRAVRSLPPRDRALVALYHLEDRPLAEVAQVLDIRPGAAKVALHRARRRLAELLAEHEGAAPSEGNP
jgi:RNA polymerase sigma factor (sigma-70 family)